MPEEASTAREVDNAEGYNGSGRHQSAFVAGVAIRRKFDTSADIIRIAECIRNLTRHAIVLQNVIHEESHQYFDP